MTTKMYFNENIHQYKDDKGFIYTSVTTLISRFFPKFDIETISAAYAKKHNMTQEAVKKMWDENGKKAADFGTMVHKHLAYNLQLNVNPTSLENIEYDKVCKKIIELVKNKYRILNIEQILFDEHLLLAGTVDCILGEGNTVYIVDWKTNKVIEKTNSYNECGTNGLYHLHNSNYNHYSLQLNLYEYLIKHMKLITGNYKFEKFIGHITPKGFKIFPVYDMPRETNIILTTLKKQVETGI